MSKVLSLPAHPATLDDDAWDDLLNFVEERRAIPIIGPELPRVDTDRGPRLLCDWLAEKLAAKLGVDPAMLSPDHNLNDVACWFLASRGRREEACTRGSDDQQLRLELAQSLYVSALAQPGAGAAELKEAAALLAGLPAPMQAYRSVKLWRTPVDAARKERRA